MKIPPTRFVAIGIVGTMLASCGTPKPQPAPELKKEAVKTKASTPTAPPSKKKETSVSFTKSIKPLLANKCTTCHCAEVMPNRPWFETRDSALKSGMIVPGKPDSSRILTVIKVDPAEADQAMPPVSHRLTEEEISLLRTWIVEGADWPKGKSGIVTPAFIPRE